MARCPARLLNEWREWCRLEQERTRDETENDPKVKPGPMRPASELVDALKGLGK